VVKYFQLLSQPLSIAQQQHHYIATLRPEAHGIRDKKII